MGGVGGEGVLFQLVMLEMAAQKLFSLGVPLTGGPARADGDELAGVFESFGAVEVLLGSEGGKREGSEEKQRNGSAVQEKASRAL